MNPLTAALLPPPLLAVATSQIIIAVLFVAGGLIKHLVEKAGNSANRPASQMPPLVPPRRPTASGPRPLATAEEERARKLMEALGFPGTEASAPAPRERSTPPPLPPAVRRSATPPPLPLLPKPASPADPLVETMRSPALPGPLTRGPEFPSSLRSARTNSPPPRSASPSPTPLTQLRALVGPNARRDLRRAILLREVLGPPQALSGVAGKFM